MTLEGVEVMRRQEEGPRGSQRRSVLTNLFAAASVTLLLGLLMHGTVVGQPSGEEVAKRLQEGVDNPEANQNKYRGGAGSFQEVMQNMKDIAKPVWKDVPDDSLDKWYSPHLRDTKFEPPERANQAWYRSFAGVAYKIPCGILKVGKWCMNGFGIPQTACKGDPECDACPLNIPWPDQHTTKLCCNPPLTNTIKYAELIDDSNFKTCCVRDGSSDNFVDRVDETRMSEEEIACLHPRGDGWAGLFEYYYPTTIFGLENQRGETMLATKDQVKQCIEKSDKLMENQQAVDWIAEAIERNQKFSGGEGDQQVAADMSKIKEQIKEDIQKVRPKDKKLRFSDSPQGEGLTVRPFLPAYDRQAMTRLAKHFCMRDEQFHKLMDDRPKRDLLQAQGFGGRTPIELDQKIPIWANYCQEGVELMTKASNSNIRNVDLTETDFIKGMQQWQKDPLYCQRMHLENPNMGITGIGDVIEKSGGAQGVSAAQVGYTCLDGDKLNGGMVPVSLYRHAAVERRTAIADHVFGFLIAGGLYPPKWLQPGIVPGSVKSAYKRFEPQPYSMRASIGYQTFWGKKFSGMGKNEVNTPCGRLTGRDYNASEQGGDGGNSDQIFLSDYTHKSFTQEPLVNQRGQRNAFDKFREDWAKDKQSGKEIVYRGLDKDAHNYGVAFRIFATCPAGYSRWRPASPHGALSANLEIHCGEENFGSPRAHVPRAP